MNEPTHLDLFSGIGGFALAAGRAGFKTIGFSEIEPYACKVLKRHWPDVPNHGDIRNVKGIHADLVTGGFPCQPFSLAGKRRGAADDRAIWPEMCRVIADSQPTWVLGENVPGIIGMELDRVLSDLEGIGYSTWPLVIPACAVDARHRRDRVWIVAHADETGRREQCRAKPMEEEQSTAERGCEDVAYSGGGESQQRREPEMLRGWQAEAKQTRMGGGDVPDSKSIRREEKPNGREQTISVPELGNTGTVWHEWPPEPAVGRVANGIPHRAHRLQGLGNAIVPQVAETLIRMMIKCL